MAKPDPAIQNPKSKIQNPMATMADLDRAVAELGIDVPVLGARLLNGRLELRLYGGRVVVWPPLPAKPAPSTLGPKPAKPARKDTDHE